MMTTGTIQTTIISTNGARNNNHHDNNIQDRNLSDYGDNSGNDNLFEDVDESAVEAAEEAQEAEEEAAEEEQDAEEDAAEDAQDAAQDAAEEEEEEAAEEGEEGAAISAAAGEDCTQDFCENQVSSDYLLRYKINVPEGMTLDTCDDGCTISFETIYEGEVWVSVGFSYDGRMIGSDAVIGIPGEGVPLKYTMTSESNDGVQPMSEDRQTLSDASVEVNNGQTIMKFTKLLKEPGEIEINAGDNIFLWATGYSETLGLHRLFSSVDVNLSSGSVAVRTAPNMSAWLAHGIMAFLAWGVLVPLAVQSSMFRGLLPKGKESLWFKIHRAFNGLAFTLTIALFAVAVAYTAKEGGDHFDEKHQIMGLAMFVLTFLQVGVGVFRPHLPPPESGDKKTMVRQGWEISHRCVGISLLACGFWQMYSGIKWYSYKYGVNGSDLLIAYWVWIGVMTILFIVGLAYSMSRIRNASKTTTLEAKSISNTAQNTLRASATDSGDAAIGVEEQT